MGWSDVLTTTLHKSYHAPRIQFKLRKVTLKKKYQEQVQAPVSYSTFFSRDSFVFSFIKSYHSKFNCKLLPPYQVNLTCIVLMHQTLHHQFFMFAHNRCAITQFKYFNHTFGVKIVNLIILNLDIDLTPLSVRLIRCFNTLRPNA